MFDIPYSLLSKNDKLNDGYIKIINLINAFLLLRKTMDLRLLDKYSYIKIKKLENTRT
jgi:hypothetical protein